MLPPRVAGGERRIGLSALRPGELLEEGRMKAQLSLFTPPPPDLSAATWRTGVVPYIDTEMRHVYVHLVRAADDP